MVIYKFNSRRYINTCEIRLGVHKEQSENKYHLRTRTQQMLDTLHRSIIIYCQRSKRGISVKL